MGTEVAQIGESEQWCESSWPGTSGKGLEKGVWVEDTYPFLAGFPTDILGK